MESTLNAAFNRLATNRSSRTVYDLLRRERPHSIARLSSGSVTHELVGNCGDFAVVANVSFTLDGCGAQANVNVYTPGAVVTFVNDSYNYAGGDLLLGVRVFDDDELNSLFTRLWNIADLMYTDNWAHYYDDLEGNNELTHVDRRVITVDSVDFAVENEPWRTRLHPLLRRIRLLTNQRFPAGELVCLARAAREQLAPMMVGIGDFEDVVHELSDDFEVVHVDSEFLVMRGLRMIANATFAMINGRPALVSHTTSGIRQLEQALIVDDKPNRSARSRFTAAINRKIEKRKAVLAQIT